MQGPQVPLPPSAWPARAQARSSSRLRMRGAWRRERVDWWLSLLPLIDAPSDLLIAEMRKSLGSSSPICPTMTSANSADPLTSPCWPRPVQVIAELVDTVLDAWSMLGFSTTYPSNPFALQIQGFSPGLCFTGGCTEPVAAWREKFITKLMEVLGPRHKDEVGLALPVALCAARGCEVAGCAARRRSCSALWRVPIDRLHGWFASRGKLSWRST